MDSDCSFPGRAWRETHIIIFFPARSVQETSRNGWLNYDKICQSGWFKRFSSFPPFALLWQSEHNFKAFTFLVQFLSPKLQLAIAADNSKWSSEQPTFSFQDVPFCLKIDSWGMCCANGSAAVSETSSAAALKLFSPLRPVVVDERFLILKSLSLFSVWALRNGNQDFWVHTFSSNALERLPMVCGFNLN